MKDMHAVLPKLIIGEDGRFKITTPDGQVLAGIQEIQATTGMDIGRGHATVNVRMVVSTKDAGKAA